MLIDLTSEELIILRDALKAEHDRLRGDGKTPDAILEKVIKVSVHVNLGLSVIQDERQLAANKAKLLREG